MHELLVSKLIIIKILEMLVKTSGSNKSIDNWQPGLP
uniref:Uncharacterized protein n=1 Tax=Arundo donax TaxID=35708 RepID=A0A0A8Z6W4_ARUDO